MEKDVEIVMKGEIDATNTYRLLVDTTVGGVTSLSFDREEIA